MANTQNLKPIQKGQLSSEEAKKRGSKGGKASGRVRGLKKTFKEAFEDELDDTKIKTLIEAMYKEAKKGNTKAFEIIRDTMGQKPIERQEIKEITSEWFKDEKVKS